MRQRSGPPGERLPSVRALAGQLAVNQNTILRVYERLTAEGLLDRRHGDGTFVADKVPGGQMKAQRQLLRQQMARRRPNWPRRWGSTRPNCTNCSMNRGNAHEHGSKS